MSRARAVALSGLAVLLEAGVPAPAALRAVAGRGLLPEELGRAAQRVEGGQPVSAALRPVFPDLAPLFGHDDEGLPGRLARLAARARHAWGLQRRLRAVSLYPVLVAVGLLVVTGAVLFAFTHRPSLHGGEVTPWPLLSGAGVAGAVVFLALTLGALWRGRAPVWARPLPGAQVWRLTAVADFVALYGLHRELTAADPAVAAARAAGLPDDAGAGARVPGGSPADDAAFAQVHAADDAGAAARHLVARLDQEAARAAARFAAVTGYALLAVAALGVLLCLLALYGQLGLVAGSLL